MSEFDILNKDLSYLLKEGAQILQSHLFSFIGYLYQTVASGQGLHQITGSCINDLILKYKETDPSHLNICFHLISLYIWTNKHILQLKSQSKGN